MRSELPDLAKRKMNARLIRPLLLCYHYTCLLHASISTQYAHKCVHVHNRESMSSTHRIDGEISSCVLIFFTSFFPIVYLWTDHLLMAAAPTSGVWQQTFTSAPMWPMCSQCDQCDRRRDWPRLLPLVPALSAGPRVVRRSWRHSCVHLPLFARAMSGLARFSSNRMNLSSSSSLAISTIAGCSVPLCLRHTVPKLTPGGHPNMLININKI